MNEFNQLVSQAPKSVGSLIAEGLSKFFDDAEKEKNIIESIIVTKPDQIIEMNKARDIRLKIRRSRLEARDIVKDQREKLKNAMSEFTLQDKLWLKAFQMLEATCDLLESKCEEKEKFAERYDAEQKQLKYESRVKKLYEYGTDSSIYALSEMTDESFEKLLSNEKLAYEARIKAEKESEEKRIAEAKVEADRQEEIRKENALLKKQALEREMLASIEAEKQAKEKAELQKQIDAEVKIKSELEAKIKAEKEDQEHKHALEKARIKAENEAIEESERKKLLAPDKEKLMELAQIIDYIKLPAVSSKEANSVIRATEDMLGKVTNYIREKAKSL